VYNFLLLTFPSQKMNEPHSGDCIHRRSVTDELVPAPGLAGPAGHSLLLAPLGVFAQDDAVRIDGSRIVANIVEPVSTAYSTDSGATVNVEISGTNTGLTRLCGGEIDIAAAARPITRLKSRPAPRAASSGSRYSWATTPWP
jgi:ABC-type phosphate transport system substrate-binding protein